MLRQGPCGNHVFRDQPNKTACMTVRRPSPDHAGVRSTALASCLPQNMHRDKGSEFHSSDFAKSNLVFRFVYPRFRSIYAAVRVQVEQITPAETAGHVTLTRNVTHHRDAAETLYDSVSHKQKTKDRARSCALGKQGRESRRLKFLKRHDHKNSSM